MALWEVDTMAVRKKTKKSAPEPIDEVKTEEAVPAPSEPDEAVKQSAPEPIDEVKAEEAAPAPSEPGEAEEEGREDPSFALKYDVNSNQRYVDSTSQKSEFDKVLDELSKISQEMLDWNVEKFTKKHGEDTGDALARKWEAFLGGFVTNAAVELYNRGYREAAFKRLEQTRTVLEAKQKLEVEVQAIRAKQDESFDLTDMLGLFGE